MAQKTPLPTKTVHYADRWNGTWFSDLSNFKHKYKEDFFLRFLITYHLRMKRLWLQFLSINNSGGFNFFQIVTLQSQKPIKINSLLYPNKFAKQHLERSQKALNTTAYFEDGEESKLWTKRLTVQKHKRWLITLSFRLKHLKSYGMFYRQQTFNQQLIKGTQSTDLSQQMVKSWFLVNTKSQILLRLDTGFYFLKERLTNLWLLPSILKKRLLKKAINNPWLKTSYLLNLPTFRFKKVKKIKKSGNKSFKS